MFLQQQEDLRFPLLALKPLSFLVSRNAALKPIVMVFWVPLSGESSDWMNCGQYVGLGLFEHSCLHIEVLLSKCSH